MATEQNWDLAEFSDDQGWLGRAVPSGDMIVPSGLSLDPTKEFLEWATIQGKRVTPSPAMLNSFVVLWRRSPEAILQFAKKWGVLFIGEDGRPGCKGRSTTNRREPLEAWRYYSRRAHAILNIAAMLKRGKRPDKADWQVLDALGSRITSLGAELGEYPAGFRILASNRLRTWSSAQHALVPLSGGPAVCADQSSKVQQGIISIEVTTWLILGRVGFALAFGGERSQLEIYYNGCLFGALALQMALVLAGAKKLYTCSGCGTPYNREQKSPKPGQANFCKACGRKEAVSQANQRRKQKMAAARRLHAEGVVAGEIAKELGTKPATVRGWIKKAR